MAYVAASEEGKRNEYWFGAMSRGRYDAQIYTNDKTNLGKALSRDVSHQTAMEATPAAGPAVAQQIAPASSLSQATRQTIEQVR